MFAPSEVDFLNDLIDSSCFEKSFENPNGVFFAFRVKGLDQLKGRLVSKRLNKNLQKTQKYVHDVLEFKVHVLVLFDKDRNGSKEVGKVFDKIRSFA